MDQFIKNIFDILFEILPSDWGKIVLRITLEQNNQLMIFYVKDKNSPKYYSFVDLQKLGIFSKFEFQNVSIQIENLSREHRKTYEKEWSGYTLVIFRDGKNYIDFEYEYNLKTLPVGWEKKYLD